MVSDKERITALETSLTYIKEKLDSIDSKVDDLQGLKFKLLGAAATIAAFISLLGVFVR